MNIFRANTKSRLASGASNINMILLLLVLALMSSTSIVIINSINKDNARNLVRVYSMEAADKFYSYLSEQLTLVRKASKSKVVTSWFTDENDEAKKKLAFDELEDNAAVLQDAHFYLGVQESLNEYSFMGGDNFASFVPHDNLDPNRTDDIWYFECIDSENEYTLRIDCDKSSNIWRLWINHKVIADGNIAGVFCSALKVPDVFNDIFDEYDVKKVRGYIIDRKGIIQSDSTHHSIYGEDYDNHIHEESIDAGFATALAVYENRIDGFFTSHSLPEVIKLKKGPYEYAAIEPVGSTNWSVVVFYNGNTLSGIANLLPLLGVMLAALFIYVVGRNALIEDRKSVV